MSQLDVYPSGHTQVFTWQSSVAPDAAPVFKVTGVGSIVVASITVATSDSTHYYVAYTMPMSEGPYMAEWFAQKTLSGSAYNVRYYQFWEVRSPDRVRD